MEGDIILITENLSTLKIHKLTQEQYNREREAGTLDETALYLTPDENSDLSAFLTIEDAESTYETQDNALTKLQEAKDYADEKFNSISLPDINMAIDAHNIASSAHDDIRNAIPTKVSQLTNDSGYITSYTETDPTVPAWAKAASKPTYTASDVGADVAGSAANALSQAKSYADTKIAAAIGAAIAASY